MGWNSISAAGTGKRDSLKPEIIIGVDPGRHNQDMQASIDRMVSDGSYKDQSVVMLIPALHTVATKAASSWLNLYAPPNQKVIRMFSVNMEVGNAYDTMIQQVLTHPDLCNFKYILTIEADNTPPPDGLVKLIKQMDAHPEYSCIGGLYWCKGEGGCAHLWGDPKTDPIVNFRPQVPVPNTLQECYGTSMGFHLWRTEMFKHPELKFPLFKTCVSIIIKTSSVLGVFPNSLINRIE